MDKGTILFIDDEALATGYYRKALRTAGHTVESVESAEGAQEKVKSETYDLIIVDIMMPTHEFAGKDNKDGHRTGCRFLKWYGETFKKRSPVIVLTNVNDEVILAEAESLGASLVLSKTSTLPGQLVSRIREEF